MSDREEDITLGKNFITCPSDIYIHRKDRLQDAGISKMHKQLFKELCQEYSDVFSSDISTLAEPNWLLRTLTQEMVLLSLKSCTTCH